MSLLAVRQALEAALAAMSPALATQWENTVYVPVDGTPYQRVYLLAAQPDNPEMGGHVIERGFLQVSLCYPLSTGPADATTRAELIRSTFKRGNAFTASGIVTQIERTPEIAPAMVEDDWYCLPLRIRFFAHHAT